MKLLKLKCLLDKNNSIKYNDFKFMQLLNILFISTPLTPMMILYNTVLPWYIIIFGDLCITSGSVWLINTVQEALERSNIYEQRNE